MWPWCLHNLGHRASQSGLKHKPSFCFLPALSFLHVSGTCQARSMWERLSSFRHAERSWQQLFIYIWTLVFVRGASSTITEQNLLTSAQLNQGQWQHELVSCQPVLTLEGQPGGRGWALCSLISGFLSWKFQFWWAVLMVSSHCEHWVNSANLNPREQFWALPMQVRVICGLKFYVDILGNSSSGRCPYSWQ